MRAKEWINQEKEKRKFLRTEIRVIVCRRFRKRWRFQQTPLKRSTLQEGNRENVVFPKPTTKTVFLEGSDQLQQEWLVGLMRRELRVNPGFDKEGILGDPDKGIQRSG